MSEVTVTVNGEAAVTAAERARFVELAFAAAGERYPAQWAKVPEDLALLGELEAYSGVVADYALRQLAGARQLLEAAEQEKAARNEIIVAQAKQLKELRDAR